MARAAVSRSRTARSGRRCMSRACSSRRSARRVSRLRAPDERADAADDHRQAQPLPHGHAKRERAEEGVGLARELGEEAEYSVADEEERRDLAARPRLGGKPPEEAEERQALAGELVELRGMPRRIARAAEHHSPGHVGDAAPELAVDEVAQTPGG